MKKNNLYESLIAPLTLYLFPLIFDFDKENCIWIWGCKNSWRSECTTVVGCSTTGAVCVCLTGLHFVLASFTSVWYQSVCLVYCMFCTVLIWHHRSCVTVASTLVFLQVFYFLLDTALSKWIFPTIYLRSSGFVNKYLSNQFQ